MLLGSCLSRSLPRQAGSRRERSRREIPTLSTAGREGLHDRAGSSVQVCVVPMARRSADDVVFTIIPMPPATVPRLRWMRETSELVAPERTPCSSRNRRRLRICSGGRRRAGHRLAEAPVPELLRARKRRRAADKKHRHPPVQVRGFMRATCHVRLNDNFRDPEQAVLPVVLFRVAATIPRLAAEPSSRAETSTTRGTCRSNEPSADHAQISHRDRCDGLWFHRRTDRAELLESRRVARRPAAAPDTKHPFRRTSPCARALAMATTVMRSPASLRTDLFGKDVHSSPRGLVTSPNTKTRRLQVRSERGERRAR